MNPDRGQKSDMEAIYAEIESTTRQALDSCQNPSSSSSTMREF